MNFNFSSQPEYTLNTLLIEETIRLYGVLTKFLIVEQINKDDVVFGDYSHLKTDSSKIYEIYMLPENSEDWDQGEYSFTNFGLTNFETVNLFVAKSSFDNIAVLGHITGNLIVFPNNKVMEITNMDSIVPGVNNLFTYNDVKSVYKITCRPYSFKLINEINPLDVTNTPEEPHETLETYFNELIGIKEEQDFDIEEEESVQTVDAGVEEDILVQKPIIDKTEDDVWGQFS